MSHDDEAAATPRGARQRGHSPLERPSLFAEFDQDHVEDIEPQRVRLLSTLESQRGRSRRPRHKRVASGTSSAWTTRALVVVMGMGMLVVLLSFIEVLRRPPPAFVSPTTPTMPATPTATTTPKAPPPIDIQAAEIIDTAPPAAPALSATPAPPAAATPPTATLLATAAADVARLNAEPTGRKAPREAERRESRESRPRSDDVALLEAMFTHTGQTNQTSQTGSLRNTPAANRKTAGPSSASTRASDAAPTGTPASATEALRQCGAASSADAAVCRARVCVQHPTTPACHVSER